MLSLIIYLFLNAGYTTPRLYGKSRYTLAFAGATYIYFYLILSRTEYNLPCNNFLFVQSTMLNTSMIISNKILPLQANNLQFFWFSIAGHIIFCKL